MATAADLILYHGPHTRSSIVLWMLEELGRPFELRVLNMAEGEHRQPAFLAINPMGKVPALLHAGTVITETGAICAYLADAFPDAGLGVPLADPRRGTYLKWLFFLPGCLEPALMDKMLERPELPRQMSGYGDVQTMLSVLAAALTPGPFLLGTQFTAADVLIGASLLWARSIALKPEQPAFTTYLARLEQRPALQRSTARDLEFAAAPPALPT